MHDADDALIAYAGVPFKPDDFERYWDETVADMQSRATDWRLEPAEFSAPGVRCDYLWFNGIGGALIRCKFLRPRQITKKIPAVCLFHGYSGHSGDWVSKLPYALEGFAVLAVETRGQMGFSEDNLSVKGFTWLHHYLRGLLDDDPRNLYCRHVFTDAAQAATILLGMDFVDERRVYASGFSQGGDLAVACAALEPRVSRIAFGGIAAADWAYYVKNLSGSYASAALAPPLRTYFTQRDPYRATETAVIQRLSYVDLLNLAPRVKATVLNFIGLQDPVCPAQGQFALYNRIESPKEVMAAPDFGHETPYTAWDAIFNFFMAD